jgi:hypothetical protein
LRLLDLILGSHCLVVSPFILDEIERVLLYPRLQARYRITIEEVARFTGNLANAALIVEPNVVMPVTLSDPPTIPSSTQLPMARRTFSVLLTRGTFPLPPLRRFAKSTASA